MNMEFKELLRAARRGNTEAAETLFLMYRPLIVNRSMVEGRFHEDLYQELSFVFLKCIGQFCPDVAEEAEKS